MGALLQPVQHPWQYWLRLDPLTCIADRVLLTQRLSEALRRKGDNSRFALLFIDLDNFKSINDQHGHLIGDTVLREVAKQLRSCIGNDGVLVRYGGDEFALLVESAVDLPED